ncbi:ribose-phosphate pyrophosphokinase, partial [Candidatus Woesearchaeota archaeon]|nr:ribose-phosphate pyrophosphokinase [Candidatus Woesearchaeota archaeon]
DSFRRKDINKDTIKDNRHPLVSDYFSDLEVQVDVGRNRLKDIIRGKHVALVEHLLTPNRLVGEDETQIVGVNDHIMTVRGFLDDISKVDTLKKTLVAPYLSYVRSHSIEKYEERGFFQFDSLRKTLSDYKGDKLNSLITIDPHSIKSAQIAENMGLEFHAINPFQSGRAIVPYKLGLSGGKAKKIFKKLRPFQEKFANLRKRNKRNNVYCVSVDDGTEKRTENFMERAYPDLEPEELYSMIAFLDKDRVSYGNSLAAFKHFSQINENNIDKEGTYVIIDDMFVSARTANDVSKILKQLGANRVEVWTSHPVTSLKQHKTANDRTYIDHVVCLDTIPQSPDLNIEYINASADLLAAELYKSHQKLVASR